MLASIRACLDRCHPAAAGTPMTIAWAAERIDKFAVIAGTLNKLRSTIV
jgi:hypothetical protein